MLRAHIKKLLRSTIAWCVICVLVLITLFIGTRYPAFIDLAYHRSLFTVVRYAFDYTLGLLPVAPVYFLFGLLLYWSFRFIRRLRVSFSWKEELLRFTRLLAGGVSLFYLLWGFNYKQTPVEDQLQLGLGHMEAPDIRQEFTRTTREMTEVMEEARHAGWTIDSLMQMRFDESEIRHLVEQKLKVLGLPYAGRVRGRLLSPGGTLLVWNTAGIYIPFVGEGHIDRGLLPYQYPYVMAHEMTHGYGIADEGSCNFVSYLACRESTNTYIRLGGVLGYWRYIASEYRKSFPGEYGHEYSQLNPLLQECLQAIAVNNRKYPEFMPTFRYHAYDQYLKAHGIKEGMQNYARVVRLVYAWFQKQPE